LGGFLLSREVEGCSPATCKTYRARIGYFFNFARLPLSEIERSDIDRYLISVRDRGCSPHYINGNYRALRTFFSWCVAEEFIPKSPMHNMKPPKVPKRAKPFIDEKTRDQLLKVCPPGYFLGARHGAMVWLYWSTGARRAEIANLQLADLDWDNSKIRVVGKGSKERHVPFTKEAKKSVWRYLSYRQDEFPCLWITEERRPAKEGAITIAMRRLQGRAGVQVKDVFHIFRRSWAMRNLKAGVPIKFIQLVGGWESVTTLESYVRAMESEDALAAKWV